MFKYYIRESKSKQNILDYLYANRNELLTDRRSFEVIQRMRIPITRISHGIYIFRDFKIDYHEEGEPVACIRELPEYFERLIIYSDDEDKFQKFLDDVENATKQLASDKELNIFIPNEYGEWSAYNKIHSRPFNTVYLDNNIKNKLKDDIKNFLESEQEYNNFGIPYKKTYLLTGIAGSGKTSLIKAICTEFNYNLSILSISKKFDNDSLMNSLKFMEDKTILLLEDIDSLFEKRESTSDNPGITFSNFINILDGVLYKHGCIIFLTTNHPEKLDHALLRIGRIDNIFRIDYPSKNNIQQLFEDLMKNKFLDTEIKSQFDLFYDYIKNKKIPMAALVNFLFRYRNNWQENIEELINTNDYIRNVLRQEKQENMYC
jgi:SpoVK/Ycf46/Vps4 family AAA+-type ATPase